MSHEPENELLDHRLRETFSEFALPPGPHVWADIEGRIAALPRARRALPLKLLLPAVALVGVGVGWLLPRPAFLRPAPPVSVPTVLRPPTLPETVLVAARRPSETALLPAPATVDAAVVPASARQYAGSSTRHHAAVRVPAAMLPVAHAAGPVNVLPVDAPPVPESASLESTAVFELSAADSAAFGPLAFLSVPDAVRVAAAGTVATSAEAPGLGQVGATASPKAESQREGHTGFRQPTHRMAERGRGIRRRLSAVAVWARQVVSPRRARTTGQPSF